MLTPAARLLAPLLALALLLTACSGDDGGDGGNGGDGGDGGSRSEAAGDAVTVLEPDWEVPVDRVPYFVPGATTRVGDLLVSRDGVVVSAFDLASGTSAWRWRPPRGLRTCSISPQAGAGDRVVGVLLEGRGRECTVAGAIDIRTGRLLWQRTMPGESPYHEGRGVAVGERTLLATLNCSEVRRFDLRTGRPVGVIARKDYKCANESATDGRVVAVLSDPVTAATPEDNGTGFIPRVDEPAAFELYDADSGRRLWRRPVATGRGADVAAVLSSDPLVLALQERGHLTNRLVGRDGRPGAHVGFTESEPPVVHGTSDGVLVLSYPADLGTELLFGYDTRTGEELWRVDLTAGEVSPAQADDTAPQVAVTPEGVVLAATVTDAESTASTWLTRFDARDPGSVVTLGAAPGPLYGLQGDRLVTYDPERRERAVGVTVPTEGEEGLAEAPAPPEFLTPTWDDGDVRPQDARRACAAVTPRTLRLLALDRRGLPEPAGCSWTERDDPTYLTRSLRTDVTVHRPALGQDPPSAVDVATEQLREVLEQRAEGPDAPEQRPVDGLGDEAHYLAADGVLTDDTAAAARLYVRWRNVVVEVSAEQKVEIADRAGSAVPDHQVDLALRAAAEDVLRELGADDAVEPAPVPADGRYTGVPDACRTVGALGREAVPGVRAVDLTRRGGAGVATGCTWEREDGTDDGSFLATVYAVPGSPFGDDAAANARRFAATVPVGDRQRVRGLRGTTWVDRYYDAEGDYRSSGVVHLAGNLLVVVDWTVPDDPPSQAEMERVTTAAARALVAGSS